jgi:homoserine kinase
VKASAPASSANLGPGYDTLALALEMRCRVEAEPANDWDVTVPDPDGFLLRAARFFTDDPHRLSVESSIPIGRGLGSSAAAAAAIGAAVVPGTLDRDLLFRQVATLDGHPDNAAAAVFGGLVAVTNHGNVLSLALHPSLRLLVAVPEETLATSEARDALPHDVSLDVAARTAARVIMLVEGLRSGDTGLLRSIGGDELHEPYRAALRPVIHRLLDAATAAGAAMAVVSGAGPSVLAVVDDSSLDRTREALAAAVGPGEVIELRPATTGVRQA